MTQLYYRDLRKRIEALEEKFFPELNFVVYMQDEDGIPFELMELTRRIYGRRGPDQPIPNNTCP